MLGVSRQLVMRLIADGDLASRRLPPRPTTAYRSNRSWA